MVQDFVHQQYVLLSPLFGEDSPILTNLNIFQSGWNHQLEQQWVVWLMQGGSTPQPLWRIIGIILLEEKACLYNEISGIMKNYHPRLIGANVWELYLLGGGFEYLLFSSLLGEMIQFD